MVGIVFSQPLGRLNVRHQTGEQRYEFIGKMFFAVVIQPQTRHPPHSETCRRDWESTVVALVLTCLTVDM